MSSSGDYDTITASGQTVNIGAGETWENKLVDLSTGSDFLVVINGEGATIRNIGFTGRAVISQFLFSVAATGNQTVTFENIYAGDGCTMQGSSHAHGPGAFFYHADASVPVEFRHCHVQGFTNNAFYCSNNANTNPVTWYRCFGKNNGVSTFRSANPNDEIRECVAYNDQTDYGGAYPTDRVESSGRPVWGWSPGPIDIYDSQIAAGDYPYSLVTNDGGDVRMHSGAMSGTTQGNVTVSNNVGGNPTLEPPDGVPMTAEEAASGGESGGGGGGSGDYEHTVMVSGENRSGSGSASYTIQCTGEIVTGEYRDPEFTNDQITQYDNYWEVTHSISDWRDDYNYNGDMFNITVDDTEVEFYRDGVLIDETSDQYSQEPPGEGGGGGGGGGGGSTDYPAGTTPDESTTITLQPDESRQVTLSTSTLDPGQYDWDLWAAVNGTGITSNSGTMEVSHFDPPDEPTEPPIAWINYDPTGEGGTDETILPVFDLPQVKHPAWRVDVEPDGGYAGAFHLAPRSEASHPELSVETPGRVYAIDNAGYVHDQDPRLGLSDGGGGGGGGGGGDGYGDHIVDVFDHSLGPYEGDLSNYEVTSAWNREGGGSVRHRAEEYTGGLIWSPGGGDLPNYPSRGDLITYYWMTDHGSGELNSGANDRLYHRIRFGMTNADRFWAFTVEVNNQRVSMAENTGSGEWNTLFIQDTKPIPANTRLRCHIAWNPDYQDRGIGGGLWNDETGDWLSEWRVEVPQQHYTDAGGIGINHTSFVSDSNLYTDYITRESIQ